MKIRIREVTKSPVDPVEIDTGNLTADELLKLRSDSQKFDSVVRALDSALSNSDYKQMVAPAAAASTKEIDPTKLTLTAIHKLLDIHCENPELTSTLVNAVYRGRYAPQKSPERRGHWLLSMRCSTGCVEATLARCGVQGFRADVVSGGVLGRVIMELLEDGEEGLATELVVSGYANVNFRRASDGRTPLHAAAEKGAEKAVRALLAAGAERNVTDSRRSTPAQLASPELRKVLIARAERDLSSARLLRQNFHQLLLPTTWLEQLAEKVGSARPFVENLKALIDWYHSLLAAIDKKEAVARGPMLLAFRHLELIRGTVDDKQLAAAASLKRLNKADGQGDELYSFYYLSLRRASETIAQILHRMEFEAAREAGSLTRVEAPGRGAIHHHSLFSVGRLTQVSLAPVWGGTALRNLFLTASRLEIFDRLRAGRTALSDEKVARFLAAIAVAESNPALFGEVTSVGEGADFWANDGSPWVYRGAASDTGTDPAALASTVRSGLALSLPSRPARKQKEPGELKRAGVILDTSYLTAADHVSLWRSLYALLLPAELARVVEARFMFPSEPPTSVPSDYVLFQGPFWLDELADSPAENEWGRPCEAQDLTIYRIQLSMLTERWSTASSTCARIQFRHAGESFMEEQVFEDREGILGVSGLCLAYQPSGFDRRFDAHQMRVVYNPSSGRFFVSATAGLCWYNYFDSYQRRAGFFEIVIDKKLEP